MSEVTIEVVRYANAHGVLHLDEGTLLYCAILAARGEGKEVRLSFAGCDDLDVTPTFFNEAIGQLYRDPPVPVSEWMLPPINGTNYNLRMLRRCVDTAKGFYAKHKEAAADELGVTHYST